MPAKKTPVPTIAVNKVVKYEFEGTEFDRVNELEDFLVEHFTDDFINGAITLGELIAKLQEVERVCKNLK